MPPTRLSLHGMHFPFVAFEGFLVVTGEQRHEEPLQLRQRARIVAT